MRVPMSAQSLLLTPFTKMNKSIEKKSISPAIPTPKYKQNITYLFLFTISVDQVSIIVLILPGEKMCEMIYRNNNNWVYIL